MSLILDPYRFPAENFNAYVDEVLADSPAGFWPFDAATYIGAVDPPQDISGNARHCLDEVDFATPTSSADAPISGMVYSPDYDGADDRLVVSDYAAWDAASISIEAWVKGLNSLGAVVTRAAVNDAISARSWDARVSTTGPWFRRDSGSNETAYQATDPAGIDSLDTNWHQVVWTYVAGTGGFKAYVDGEACAAVDTTGALNSGTEVIMFGARQDTAAGTGATSFNSGRICLVSIYPGTVLSAARVSAHYAAAVGA
jgi:hypothetical protein